MEQHYFLVCPVNSKNEEKLAGQGEACIRLLTNATYPRLGGGHASVHSVSDCQRHTLQYRTCGVPSLFDFTKRRRAKRKVQQYEQYYYQNRMVEPLYSYFILISDKVHIYSGEGRKTAAQQYSIKNIEHIMIISINHARIYLDLRVSPSVCSRSSSLSRNGGLTILPSIEIGLLTLWSHMSVICQEEVH